MSKSFEIHSMKFLGVVLCSAWVLIGVAQPALADPDDHAGDAIEKGTFPTLKQAIDDQWSSESKERIKVNAVMNADLIYSKNSSGKYRDSLKLVRNDVVIEARISDMVKAVVGFELNRTLRESGSDVSDDFNSDEFLAQFEIQVKPDFLNGGYVAVGKLLEVGPEIPTELLRHQGSPIEDLNEIRQVYGFAVHLPNFLNFLDVQATVFETSEYDLDIRGGVGGNIVLSKNFLENRLKVQSGLTVLQHQDEGETEVRVPVSLFYKVSDAWKVYGEAIYFKNNEDYPDSQFALSGGTSYEIAKGVKLVLEGTYVEKALYELATGAVFEVSRNVTVGPEVRYTVYDGENLSDGHLSFGGRVRVVFGPDFENSEYILDGAEKPTSITNQSSSQLGR